MDYPRLAVVGAGDLSTRRIYPYIAAAGARLVGVCDRHPEKAERNAELFGGTPYKDMETMLDAEKPDGVLIAVGAEEHAELAMAALYRGVAVYTEKPPAATALEALEVARVAEETRVLCMTAFKKRYNIAYTRAKRFLDDYPLSDHLSLSIDYASSEYVGDGPEASFLLDFAIHMIDLSMFLFGDVRQAYAFSRGTHAYAVSLLFASGAVGSLNLTDGRSLILPTEEVEITVRGGNYMSIHNSSSWKIVREGIADEWREPPTFVSAGDSGNETGHLAEIVEFVEAIKERRPTRSHIYESYKSMVLYEAILASSLTGHVADLNYDRPY